MTGPPKFLEMNYLLYLVSLCNRKNKFGKYREIIDRGLDNFNHDLELINLIKKIRMHGIECMMKLTKHRRKLIVHLANFRPVKK